MCKKKDDLDRTLEHCLKDPEFKEEWELSEPQTQVVHFIAQILIEHKITKAEFASKVGVSKNIIDRIIGHDYDPKLELVARIARAFGKRLEIKFV